VSARRQAEQAGEALARALEERAGAPVGTEQGRSLLLALVRLNELGALAFDVRPQLSTVPGPEGQPGAVVRCGEAQPLETAPAYNMGSLFASGGDSE
jgi:hypothetical protein